MLPKEPYKRILVITAYILIGAGLAYVAAKHLAGVLAPFLIAYLIAVVLHPLVDFVCKKTKLPRFLTVIVVLLVTTALLCGVVYLVGNRVYTEINTLYQTVSQLYSDMKSDENYAEQIIDTINGYIPFIDYKDQLMELWENVETHFYSMVSNLITNLNGVVIPAISAVINTVPSVLFGLVVAMVALYYFLAQYHRINRAVVGIFPEKIGAFLVSTKRQVISAVIMFLRAYGVIMLITFMEVFVGLIILRVKYAFLIAALTALVDIMPILGTGAILVPWGIIEIIRGNYFLGIGLLVLYVVITVVRQFLEPKIVGKSVGLHPLLALVSMYVGLKLFGVLGLFGLPILLVMVTRMYENGVFHAEQKKECPCEDPAQCPMKEEKQPDESPKENK